jgi:3-oxoacyl-[acyl-carrier protein] reductase
LKGQVALVTGSSRGIGRGIARVFAKEGSMVIVNSRSPDRAEAVAREIIEEGGQAFPIGADVTDANAVQGMVEQSIERFKRIDILVNNAGITFIRPAEDLTEEEWDRAVATDLKAYFLCSQAVGRTMIRNGGGNIINITSILAERALPQRLPYCVSKAGANMLTMVLALEWARHNIRVNAIMPGFVATGLVPDRIDKKTFDREAIIQKSPLQRLAKVEEVADAAVFLVSKEAAFITGTCLRVDGGWLAYGGW